MNDKWQVLQLFLAFPDAMNQNKQERVKKSVNWQCFRLKFGKCLLQTLAGSSVILNEGFKWISSAPPGNAEPVPLLGHHHILPKFSPMHHSLVILTFSYQQCHKSNNKKINNKSSAKSIPLNFPCIKQWDSQHCSQHNCGVTHFCGKQWIPSPSDDHDYSFPAQESRLNHSVLQPLPDYQLSSQTLFLPQFHLQIGTVTMYVIHVHVEGTMFVIGIKCRGLNFNS